MLKLGVFLFALLATAFAAPTFDLPLLPGALPETASSRYLPFREINYGGRIISGSAATRGDFPHQAALYLTVPGGTSFCGGSLISNRWILTAAHCTAGVSAITAYLGVVSLSDTANRVTGQASSVVSHPSYSSSTLQNDIALVQLSTTVSTSSYVSIVTLASATLGSGVSVTVSGWGRTSDSSTSISQTLNHVSLTTITNAICANTYGSIIQNGIVCATGASIQSTCNGDSGGPLVTGSKSSAVQVGIVSFGSSAGCAKGYATAYTRVAYYRSWITANAGV